MGLTNPEDAVVPGTRILLDDFGLIGSRFRDPKEDSRFWTVVGTLKAIIGRPNRGFRLRVIDQVGIISMVEIADYSLLKQLAKPGEFCPYTQDKYPEVGDEHAGWRGLFMEEEDAADDLHIRELELRQQLAAQYGYNWWEFILPEMQLTRYLHTSERRDVERLDMLLRDFDPDTGEGPDPDIGTLGRRWVKVHQEDIVWAELQ